jgi:hypothetical protein
VRQWPQLDRSHPSSQRQRPPQRCEGLWLIHKKRLRGDFVFRQDQVQDHRHQSRRRNS